MSPGALLPRLFGMVDIEDEGSVFSRKFCIYLLLNEA